MTPTHPPPRTDQPVDVKIVLSGLWAATLFACAYVDLFGFWRADVLRGALAGRVPGVDLTVDQAFLLKTTAYVLLPCVMIVASLLAPARINRPVNVVASLLYAVSVAVSVVGERWMYYELGSLVEVVFLVAITRVAWAWPRRSGG